MTKKDTIKTIGAASFIMMASVFASRVIGVFREAAIAGIGGIHAQVDAYQVAFVLPEILNHIVASGFLSITFIPIFTRYLEKDDKTTGWEVLSSIHHVFGLALVILIGISMIFAPQLVSLLAPGIKAPETVDLAVKMTRIVLPAQWFFFSGGLLMAVQFAHKKFFIPALAPLIYNLSIIAFGLLLGSSLGMEGFAWGVLFGAFAGNFALQAIAFYRLGGKMHIKFAIFHPDLFKYFIITVPLIIGMTMTFSTEIQFKFFGSFLEEGSIAALNYALRIMFSIVGLFGQAIGVAIYPFLTQMAVSGKTDELNRLLNQTLKYIILIIPVAILFAVLSHEIVRILFQRGSFDALATEFTAGLLPFFMIGAFAFSAQTIVSRGFYAMQNTLFPAILSTVCVGIGLVPAFFLMKSLGPKGVAIGISFTAMLQTIILYETWNLKSHNTGKTEVYRYFLKTLIMSAFLGAVIFWCAHGLRMIFNPELFTGAVFICCATGAIFILIFYAMGRIFSIDEITSVFSKAAQKIRRSN